MDRARDRSHELNRETTNAILDAADNDPLASAMRAFYESLDAAITERRPTCWNKGACCKFGEFGHRLYVTSVEAAYFAGGLRHEWRPPTSEDRCPYQIDGLCTAREHRPMGCRVFFCDPASSHWQSEEYERCLARLKAICSEHGVEYRYVEWLSALRALSEAFPPGETGAEVVSLMQPIAPSIDPGRPGMIELPQVS